MNAILETFATLRIFSPEMHPRDIGLKLGIDATDSYERDAKAKSKTKRQANYWGWCTEEALESTDSLAHVKKIIDTFSGKNEELEQLRSAGCAIDICGYVVNSGQGGPELDIDAMQQLSELRLPIWWDVYKGDDNKT